MVYLRNLALLLLVFFTSNSFCLQPLDYDALVQTHYYREFVHLPQTIKDHELKKAGGGCCAGSYSRTNIAIALLAGANISRYYKIFSDAVNDDDSQLLKLIFQKTASAEYRKNLELYGAPWRNCRKIEIADLLVENGIPILGESCNAVRNAIVCNRSVAYINGLLQRCPLAAIGTIDPQPMMSAVLKPGEKKQLLKILVDYGADPYRPLTFGHGLSPLQLLATRGVTEKQRRTNRELAQWLEEYHRERLRFVFTTLTHARFSGKKFFPPEVVVCIMGSVSVGYRNDLNSLTFEEWKSYGS